MKFKVVRGFLFDGEWREPDDVIETSGPHAEHIVRSGAAVPVGAGHETTEAPEAPEKALGPGHHKGKK
jgi:hypothetical protein